MLVLTRSEKEQIVIGENILLTCENVGENEVTFTIKTARGRYALIQEEKENLAATFNNLAKYSMYTVTIGKGNEITLGDNIKIQICQIKSESKKARFGITAPVEIPVHRLEVYLSILLEERMTQVENENTGNNFG